jgi:hypothetical protein
MAENAALAQTVAQQRNEIAGLKRLKGRLDIKPSGMEKATVPRWPSRWSTRGGAARSGPASSSRTVF